MSFGADSGASGVIRTFNTSINGTECGGDKSGTMLDVCRTRAVPCEQGVRVDATQRVDVVNRATSR